MRQLYRETIERLGFGSSDEHPCAATRIGTCRWIVAAAIVIADGPADTEGTQLAAYEISRASSRREVLKNNRRGRET